MIVLISQAFDSLAADWSHELVMVKLKKGNGNRILKMKKDSHTDRQLSVLRT